MALWIQQTQDFSSGLMLPGSVPVVDTTPVTYRGQQGPHLDLTGALDRMGK